MSEETTATQSGESKAELGWYRSPACADGPDGYYSTEGPLSRQSEWALFPERGGRGWDVAWQPTEDDGYDYMDTFSTVEAAKREATRLARRNAAKVLA